MQFHPEVSEPTFAGWAAELPDVDAATVVRELAGRDAEIAAAGRDLAARFARIVANVACGAALGSDAMAVGLADNRRAVRPGQQSLPRFVRR